MGRYDSPGGDCKPKAKGERSRVGGEGSGSDEALVGDLKRSEVADSRVRQLEGMMENEKAAEWGLRQTLAESPSFRRRTQGF